MLLVEPAQLGRTRSIIQARSVRLTDFSHNRLYKYMTNVLARWSRRFSRLTSVETRPLPRPAGSRPGKKFDAGTVSATITYFQRLRRLQPFCQSVESARILEVTRRLFDAVFHYKSFRFKRWHTAKCSAVNHYWVVYNGLRLTIE